MRKLTWHEYYTGFDNWAPSTRAQYVSRLDSVGRHEEVDSVVSLLESQGAADRLLNMALDAGLRFTDA